MCSEVAFDVCRSKSSRSIQHAHPASLTVLMESAIVRERRSMPSSIKLLGAVSPLKMIFAFESGSYMQIDALGWKEGSG